MLTVTEQLDAGVRYLDLRIAHMPEGSAKNLHFVHMMYTTLLVEVGGGGRWRPARPLAGGGWPLPSVSLSLHRPPRPRSPGLPGVVQICFPMDFLLPVQTVSVPPAGSGCTGVPEASI